MIHHMFAAVVMLAVGVPAASQAQQPAARPTIGWVTGGGSGTDYLEPFRLALRELGYIEGQSVIIETRSGSSDPASVREVTKDLLARNPTVIVAVGPAIHGVRRAAVSVPVVFAFSGDPVEAGLVDTMARPGGNFTGMSFMSYELNGKRLELLREAFPQISRVALLSNPMHPGEHIELRESENAAERLGFRLRTVRVAADADFDSAFDNIRRAAAEAIIVLPDALVVRNRARILEFAGREKIPTLSGWALFAQSGAVMTYGPNLRDSYRRIATYVDKIIKGARPSELPVEQPSKIELVVNLKAARALGVEIPPSVLARADEVIE